MSGGEWGIFRTHTSVDEFGKRHTVDEWVLKRMAKDEFSYDEYMSFDTEGEARGAAGVYNSMDKHGWVYVARKL